MEGVKYDKSKTLYHRFLCEKIDIHTHLLMTEDSIRNRLIANSVLGISKCVLLPGTPERKHVDMMLPEDAYEIVKKYPNDFAWLCNLAPDGTDATREKILRYKEMGAVGLGEFGLRYRFDDPRMEHMFSILEELDMPFLFHMAPEDRAPFYGVLDDPRMPGLEHALKNFPKLKIIGHSQTFWFEIAKSDVTDPDVRNSCLYGKFEEGRIPELMRKYDNLYCDLSAYSGQTAMMRDPEYAVKFMNEFPDRIFYGTDWILEMNGPFHFALATWLDLKQAEGKLSKEVYQKICSGNAQRVFFSER